MRAREPRFLLPASLAVVTALGSTASAQITVDTNDRGAVQAFYRQYFGAGSRNVTPNWTGSPTGCNAGTVDQAYLDATLTRINAYRALMDRANASIPGYRFNNDDEQLGAMLMQITGQVGQQRVSNFTQCFTADGNWALDRSMQAAAVGTDAIDLAMRGTLGNFGYDQSVIMQPTVEVLRVGSTDSHMLVNISANPQVFPNTGSAAWPAAGYMPYQLLPDTWCFNAQSYPWAPSNTTRHDRFDNATVTVTRNGVPLQINLSGKPRRAYVWTGMTWTFAPGQLQHGPGMGDVTYDVTIQGISGLVTSYTYSITVFDPTPPGTFTPYGQGCGFGSGVTLSAAPGSRPAIGSTLTTQLAGIQGYGDFAALNLGITRMNTALDPLGLPGCSLYTDIQLSIGTLVQTHPVDFSLPIPNVPSLIGGQAFVQAAALDFPAVPTSIVTSNGGALVFGY